MLGLFPIFVYSIFFWNVYGQELPTCATSYYSAPSISCDSPQLETKYCPDGFDQVGDYCFKVGTGNNNWKRSKYMCEALGTKLAEPDNLLYNSTDFAKYLWQKGGDIYGFMARIYSLGGQFENNNWKWLSGNEVISNEGVNNFYGGNCLSIHVSNNINGGSYKLYSIPCKPSSNLKWARAYRYVCQTPILKGYEPCYHNKRIYYSGQLVSMDASQCQQNRCLNGKIEQLRCGNITEGCCEYRGLLYGEGDIIGNANLKDCNTCEQRVCRAGVIQWQDCASCSQKCCSMDGESYLPWSLIKSKACSLLQCNGSTGEFYNRGRDLTCRTCKVYLDPHIITYDSSRVYTYQKCGNYTLTQFGSSYEPTTAVYGTFKTCGISSRATCLDTITFKNDEHTVITMGYGMTQVNGENFNNDRNYSVQVFNKHGSSCITVEGNSGIKVTFCGSSGASSAYLWASPNVTGELRGLCGTANDNVDDDFMSRNGNIISTWRWNPPVEFTSSWMASNTSTDDCNVTPSKNRCEKNTTVRDEFQRQCRETIKNLYANAEPDDLQSIIDACVFDLCNVDDPEEWLRVVRETTEVQATILEESSIYHECGTETSENGTYFINNNYPEPYDGVDSCELTINKMNSNICQLRLDFVEMILAQPNSTNHECLTDRFIVSGSSSEIPTICGTNTGNHMYVHLDPTNEEPVLLSLVTVGPSFLRKWKIKFSQIPCTCNNAYTAPNHCLQYFQSGSGTIKSFNFDVSSGLQLSNQDYTICVRSEKNACGIEYTPCEDKINEISQSFTLSGNTTSRPGSLVGSRSCFNDWLAIPCVSDNATDPWSNCEDRLCGDSFNIIPSTSAGNVPLYSYVRPFRLVYHTDGLERNSTSFDKGNKGFCLDFVQQPCS